MIRSVKSDLLVRENKELLNHCFAQVVKRQSDHASMNDQTVQGFGGQADEIKKTTQSSELRGTCDTCDWKSFKILVIHNLSAGKKFSPAPDVISGCNLMHFQCHTFFNKTWSAK